MTRNVKRIVRAEADGVHCRLGDLFEPECITPKLGTYDAMVLIEMPPVFGDRARRRSFATYDFIVWLL